jgi:hypothetical protein
MTRAVRAGRAARLRVRGPDAGGDRSRCETWRVGFCVAPHGLLRRRRGEAARAGERAGGVNLNALALARRLEALRRVLENPAPALARLCRLLAGRRTAVQAAFRPYRPRATPVQTLLPAAQAALELAFNRSCAPDRAGLSAHGAKARGRSRVR